MIDRIMDGPLRAARGKENKELEQKLEKLKNKVTSEVDRMCHARDEEEKSDKEDEESGSYYDEEEDNSPDKDISPEKDTSPDKSTAGESEIVKLDE